jgi:hypothetical protein
VAEQYEVPARLFPDIQMVLDYVEQASEEYLLLSEENDIRVYRYGFEYLNSGVFAATNARLSEIEDNIIGRTRDRRLIDALASWRLINQRREHDMVRSIYEYARQTVFRTGVFLVGAAHKTGILKAIGEYAGPDIDSISWGVAHEGAMFLGTA